MVIASHVILSAYGFWLPNEQRGSWSDFVRNWELLRFGDATKVETTRSVARAPCDWDRRREMQAALRHPAVTFSGEQAREIGRAFAEKARSSGHVIHACAILPTHVHLVIRRHAYHVEQIANLLKGHATRALITAGLHPMAGHVDRRGRTPSCWDVGLWKVFLDSRADVRRAIAYVEDNPEKEGKPRQHWSMVTRFE